MVFVLAHLDAADRLTPIASARPPMVLSYLTSAIFSPQRIFTTPYVVSILTSVAFNKTIVALN